MYNGWKEYISPFLGHFPQQDLIIGMLFYAFAKTAQNKITLINLFLIT